MNVLIIIVNYGTPQLVVDCLKSLEKERHSQNIMVEVVDNNSPDESVFIIEDAIKQNGWDQWVRQRNLPENVGFARGNNAVLREAINTNFQWKYFFLLNPDTKVRSGAIEKLVQFLEQHPDIGIAGSGIENPDGTVRCSAFRYPTHVSEFIDAFRLGVVSRCLSKWVVAPEVLNEPHKTDWVSGAAMMIRSEVLKTTGFFDEKYFLYYEELDYCLSAMRRGWSCWYVPMSRVVHFVGQSTGVTGSFRNRRRIPQYWFDSRKYFFRKNYGFLYSKLADIAWLLGFIMWQTRRIMQRKPKVDPPCFFRDFMKYNFFFRGGVK